MVIIILSFIRRLFGIIYHDYTIISPISYTIFAEKEEEGGGGSNE
jgi:hypothetical protein